MRKFALGLCSVVLGGCGLLGGGGGGGGGGSSQPDPYMIDTMYTYYDVSKLKEGDYVEYETSAAGNKSMSRLACVKIETSMVWIETGTNANDWVTLVGVDKGDRKVKKAYFGQKGKEAKEIKVQTAPTGGGATTDYKQKGTAKVSKDTVTISGTAFNCEKTDMDTTTTVNGSDSKNHSTTWYSEQVPFKYYWDGKDNSKDNPNVQITWEGKPTYPGGLVKMVSEGSGYKSEQTLSKWGSDAKMSVTLPAAK